MSKSINCILASYIASETGTFAFKAPETYEHAFTTVSDVFSFGMVCYEIATRTPVFAGQSTQEIIDNIRYKNVRPNLQLVSDTKFAEIIGKCWQYNPNDRYQSFSELVDIFENHIYASTVVFIDWQSARALTPFGSVHEAVNMSTRELCIVKEANNNDNPSSSSSASAYTMKQFETELAILQHIAKNGGSEHIASLIGTCSNSCDKNNNNNNSCIVLQHYEPKSLKNSLATIKSYTLESKIALMQQVANMVSAIHKLGVIHCDFCSANIMVCL